MNNRLRRYLGGLVLIVLTFFLMTGTHLTAEATEPDVITQINVEVEVPKAGATNYEVVVKVPDGADYTVIASPQKWDDAGGYEVDSPFVDGNEYKAVFDVTAINGKTLAKDAIVIVNGSQDNVNFLGGADESRASMFDYTILPRVNDYIYSVELNDVPTAKIGDQAKKYSYSETKYKATGTWQCYDDVTKSYVDMNTDAVFEMGKIYRLLLVIDPEDGYVMVDDCWIAVNGEDEEWESFSSIEAKCGIDVSYATEIERLVINEAALPKAVIGESFKDESIPISVDEKYNCSVSGYWCLEQDGSRAGVFEDGKAYEFVLEFTPNAGYSLSKDFRVEIGKDVWPYISSPTNATYSLRTSFAPVLDKIQLLNLPTAKVNDTLQMGHFKIEVPKEAKYAAEAYWEVRGQYGYEPIQTSKVEKGKMYRLSVDIYTEDGYEFTDSVIINAYGVDYKENRNSENYVCFEKEFSFCEVLSKIEIIGMEAKIGEAATTTGLKVPQGANYKIVSAVWIDMDKGEDAAMFEDGHEYHLRIGVTANEGYEFSKKAVSTINGEKALSNIWGKEAYVDKRVSFKKPISEIKIDNIPTVKVGEKATTDVAVPTTANYSASVNWRVWNETKKEFEEFEGVFENGKIYSVVVHVTPMSGYCFDEETTKFFIDGKESDEANVYSGNAHYQKDYAADHKVIDKIEFTVNEPVVGHHASIEPVICTKDGANYQVSGKTYVCWLEGNIEEWNEFEDIFMEDGKYGVHFNAIANEGYVFSEDLIVVVNDIVLSEKALLTDIKNADINYFFDMECVHYYDDDTDATCNACGEKREVAGDSETPGVPGTPETPDTSETPDTPETGDRAQMGLLIICTALSGMVIVYSGVKRRKRG